MKIGNGRGEATPGQRTQLPAPRQGCQRRRGELDQCSICDPHRGQNCRLHPVFDFLFAGVPASAGLRFAKKPPKGGTPTKRKRKSCLRLLFSSLESRLQPVFASSRVRREAREFLRLHPGRGAREDAASSTNAPSATPTGVVLNLKRLPRVREARLGHYRREGQRLGQMGAPPAKRKWV